MKAVHSRKVFGPVTTHACAYVYVTKAYTRMYIPMYNFRWTTRNIFFTIRT